jgi:hypothetical protein
MADKADKPKTKPSQDPKAAGTAKRRPFWSAKRISMWLAGPTALLVFLNEAATVKQLFTSSGPLPKGQVTVVVEHHDPDAAPAADPHAPSFLVEAARFDEQDPHKLDIVCRNASAQPVFIHAAAVELVQVWRLQPVVTARGLLASSASYDLTLPAAPTKIEKALTQEIPPKALERFSITIGPASSKEVSPKVFHFRLQLLCGSESTPAGEFLYMTPPGSGTPQPSRAVNGSAVAEILKVPGKQNTLLTTFLATAPAD